MFTLNRSGRTEEQDKDSDEYEPTNRERKELYSKLWQELRKYVHSQVPNSDEHKVVADNMDAFWPEQASPLPQITLAPSNTSATSSTSGTEASTSLLGEPDSRFAENLMKDNQIPNTNNNTLYGLYFSVKS